MSVATVRSVSEIVLNVGDIALMRGFYERTLGFTLHSQFPETDPTIVFLTIVDHQTPLARGGHPMMLALIDPVRHPPAAGRFDSFSRRTSTLNHVAFEIDEQEHDAARQRLEQAGLRPVFQQFPFLKAKALFFEDPEGNMLELICHDSSVP